jgi:hypothetical protein
VKPSGINSRPGQSSGQPRQIVFSTRYKGLKHIGIRLPYDGSGKLPSGPKLPVLVGNTLFEGIAKLRAVLAEELNPLLNLSLDGVYDLQEQREGDLDAGGMNGEVKIYYRCILKRAQIKLPESILAKPGLRNKVLSLFPEEYVPVVCATIAVSIGEARITVTGDDYLHYLNSDAVMHRALAECKRKTLEEIAANIRNGIEAMQAEMIAQG